MKKSTGIAVLIVILVIIGIVVFGRGGSPAMPPANSTQSPAVVVTDTKVSSHTSQYQNAELGFSVTYPTAWEVENTDTGVTFIMPIDQGQVSTVAKLQADINVVSGKCAFPPVTSIQDRGTLTAGSLSMNMISMTNSTQGRNYFDRMYELQQGEVCYVFHFSSITFSPESRNLTGSNVTQAQNNNRAIISTSDGDFTSMVKSFVFVQGPAGKDETQVSPAK